MPAHVAPFIVSVAVPSLAIAGARIDLRPTPPGPPFESFQTVRVDVFLVDTGNPQGDIHFRGLFLDFSDTSLTLSFPGEGPPNPIPPNQFHWNDPEPGLGSEFLELPKPAWVFTAMFPLPELQITLPDNGEVNIGHINVNLGPIPYDFVLDVVNADDPDPLDGAIAVFGYGANPNDPLTEWRAFTGDLTGGRLVVPEPSMALAALVACAGWLARAKTRHERSR